MSNDYTPLALPPQEPQTVFVCGTCSALVANPAQHDTTCTLPRLTPRPTGGQ